jgi:hypothetical protein
MQMLVVPSEREMPVLKFYIPLSALGIYVRKMAKVRVVLLGTVEL